MSLHRLAGVGVLLTACAPPIEPAWLVSRPRELALEVEVVAQGPYGRRMQPGPRTYRDALPRDTLSLRPVIVDPQGSMDLAAFEIAWTLCSGIGSCLLRGSVLERPACTNEELQPPEPCLLAEGGEVRLTLADLPAVLPTNLPTVLNLVSGPTVGLVASPPDGPGVDACLARLDAREPLEDCLLMERVIGIGPVGELAALLDEQGIDPGLGDDAQTLLERPRNRNPTVEHIRVELGDDVIVVESGSTLAVPRDQDVTLTLETTDDDLDGYETILGDETVELSDDLGAEWWFDRELDVDGALPGQLWVRLRAGTVTGTARAYAVLRDNRGGEGWGWLDLDFGE